MRILLFLAAALAFARDSGIKVEYIGGTLGTIRAGNDMRIHLSDAASLSIDSGQTALRVPYPQINQIEYGQKVGRNIVPAIVISPLFLLNKTRKHFLTLGYVDETGRQQAVVMRVDKGDIRAMLAGLEARTGLRVVYLDDEARKM